MNKIMYIIVRVKHEGVNIAFDFCCKALDIIFDIDLLKRIWLIEMIWISIQLCIQIPWTSIAVAIPRQCPLWSW